MGSVESDWGEVGKRIRLYRGEAGLTQAELAAKLSAEPYQFPSVDQTLISHWERGGNVSKFEYLLAIEEILLSDDDAPGTIMRPAGIVPASAVPALDLDGAVGSAGDLVGDQKKRLIEVIRGFRSDNEKRRGNRPHRIGGTS